MNDDQRAGYVLTPHDQLIVDKTTERVTDEDRPKIIAIHEMALVDVERRRTALMRDLEGVERAIAMRRAALEVLHG